MFLTKKTLHTKKQSKNSKALGGWGDNDDQPESAPYSKLAQPNRSHIDNYKSTYTSYSNTGSKKQQIDMFPDTLGYVVPTPSIDPVRPTPQSNSRLQSANTYYSPEQLAQMTTIQCQCQLVETILQPGGIRVKQTQRQLNQFLTEAKTMNIAVIGSLLISQLLNEDAGYHVKVKALHAIDFLARKNLQYSVYFKLHVEVVQDSPAPEQNQEMYLKVKKMVLSTLGAVILRPGEGVDAGESHKQGLEYEDPGYVNKEEKGLLGFIGASKKQPEVKQKQKHTKKLISPDQLKKKKPLSGPPQKQPLVQEMDLLSLDLLQPAPQSLL